jgi:hypothetical protein
VTRWSSPTAPEPEDVGHLLPADVWQQVREDAARRAERLQGVVPAGQPTTGRAGRFALPDRTIAARSHGGIMPGGPRLGVIHSAETPLAAGYAYSIAANWFATKATTSATVMIDPAETIRLLPDNVVSYAVGPRANGFTVNVEQSGRAVMASAEWLSPNAGRPQMVRVATYMRECRDIWGMPLRWATDAQIRAAAAGGAPQGWCTHDDVRRVLGGTTHTDPGGNYPRGELMALATGGQLEDDMGFGPEAAMTVAETRWLVGQMKPVLDGLHVTLAEEDAQTDRLEYITNDPEQGLRAMVQRVLNAVDPAQPATAPALQLPQELQDARNRRRAAVDQLGQALRRMEQGPTAEELAPFLADVPAVAS